jgi:hypothetical protein
MKKSGPFDPAYLLFAVYAKPMERGGELRRRHRSRLPAAGASCQAAKDRRFRNKQYP